MAVQWLTPAEQRAWRAYLRTGTLLTARLNRQLQADSGLSLPEYEVLVQLSEAPDGKLRPFQLGLVLNWEQSRLSHLLSRMTRRGFVIRQDCPGDRRGAVVVVTGPGRAAIESAAPGHVAAVRRLVFDQMDTVQARAFGRTFEAILAALEADGQRKMTLSWNGETGECAVPPMEWRPDRRLTPARPGTPAHPSVPEGGEWTMSEPTVKLGDAVRVTVTKVLPFAVLVETATGVPGLVKHVGPQQGDVMTVTVTAVDDDQRRFSGTLPTS